jgi:hypothetical protein
MSRRRLRRGLALALIASAMAVPAVAAAPIEPLGPAPSDPPEAGGKSDAPEVSSPAPGGTTITVSGDDGFDWGDAGIGAAVVLAGGAIAGGAALAIGRDRPRQ